MKRNTRTKNSLMNSSIGSISQMISTFLNFLVRTIFIHYLSNEYLGINGLFSNILYVLNFAELGISNAIIYNMYKPVAEDNKERIKSLVNLYHKVYFIIGIIVLLIGLSILPFMEYIIKEPPQIKENLNTIYLLYLLETTGTYFFGYKRSIFLVYQKNYINNLIDFIFSVVKSLLQAIILIVTKNYILYLLIYIISTICSNIYISFLVNKQYPFLTEKNIIKVKASEIKIMWQNVKSLFMYKLGNTILNGTDNIILSITTGIASVGLYSNYSLIITAVSGILWSILTGLTGSIGNLNATQSNKKQEEIFHQVLFLSCLLYGSGCVCLGVLLKPFITIWIGESYLLDNLTALFVVSVCYLRGLAFAADTYRDTLGLFHEGRLAPLFCSIINIILSLILGNYLGIKGVFLATDISILLTTFWYMPKIIYAKIFHQKASLYFKKVFIYTLPFAISYIVCTKTIELISQNTIIAFIVKILITITITTLMTIIFEYRTNECQEITHKIINQLKKKKDCNN